MALTIDDIYDKEFATRGGGYDPNDVDRFLDEICDEMTQMLEHIGELEKKLQQAQMETEAAQASARQAAPIVKNEPVARTSETLEGILLSAQRLADEAVENARNKADVIVKEAQDKATQIVDEARGEKEALSGELDALRTSVAEYKEGFLTLINKYKTLLENEALLAD